MTEPDRYGVIGQPVKHSWSPFIHALFARETGQNLVYHAHEVPAEALLEFLPRFFADGGKGLNVTLPHKPAAARWAAALTPRAALAGAVNTLAAQADGTVLGDNTDGAGFVRDLQRHLGVTLAGQRILVLGAGGAARGLLGPLLECAPAEILLANRGAARAHEVAAVFERLGCIRGCSFAELPAAPFDLVINATAASLAGEVPAVTPAVIAPHTLCYDLAYGHRDTAFLGFARAAGAGRAVQGWGMLVEQAAEAFTLWRGVRPDGAAALAALRERAG